MTNLPFTATDALLVGINAKYIHTNLAIHSIQAYAACHNLKIALVEYTINQDIDLILDQIIQKKPSILGFSCYIWNRTVIENLLAVVKKILPETFIFLGGPEVSYDLEATFNTLKSVDAIVYGEGEATTKTLIEAYTHNESLSTVTGIAFRQGTSICINPPTPPLNLDQLPFVYQDHLDTFKNRILYYESSRGCPFRCSYCLSSVAKDLRYKSLEKTLDELNWFLQARVMQVKFIDRTFNCNPKRALSIWDYLIQNDNGITNFHFEIAADLLDKAAMDLLQTARPGLLQLEIGVQSTNQETLRLVQRVTDFKQLSYYVKALMALETVHIHLDLIAGLPEEDWVSFSNSFNDVYALRPHQLQLGFLKVLHGARLQVDADTYGLIYRPYPPYEILATRVLTYQDLSRLKAIETMIDLYYNSGYYTNTLRLLENLFETPFKLYHALGTFFVSQNGHLVKHSKLALYELLSAFGKTLKQTSIDVLNNTLLYDLLLQEKIKKYPDWYNSDETLKTWTRDFFRQEAKERHYMPHLSTHDSKALSRLCHIEHFNTPLRLGDTTYDNPSILLDYTRRSPITHAPITFILDKDGCS